MLQGLDADPEGSGQATLAGSPSAGGSSWAALADSALPQGPLLEEAAPAPVEVSHRSFVIGAYTHIAAVNLGIDGLACKVVLCCSHLMLLALCSCTYHMPGVTSGLAVLVSLFWAALVASCATAASDTDTFG